MSWRGNLPQRLDETAEQMPTRVAEALARRGLPASLHPVSVAEWRRYQDCLYTPGIDHLAPELRALMLSGFTLGHYPAVFWDDDLAPVVGDES